MTYTLDSDSLDLEFHGYWFKPSVVAGSSVVRNDELQVVGAMPETIEERLAHNIDGLMVLQRDGISTELAFSNTNLVFNDNGARIKLAGQWATEIDSLVDASNYTDADILVAARADGTQTVTSYSYGSKNTSSLVLDGWSSTGDAAMFLPPKNGIVTVTATDTSGTETDVVLLYDLLTTAGDLTLVGLYSPDSLSQVPDPGTYTIVDNATVTFGKFAIIKSTGRVGSGSGEIYQTISFYKPLKSAQFGID